MDSGNVASDFVLMLYALEEESRKNAAGISFGNFGSFMVDIQSQLFRDGSLNAADPRRMLKLTKNGAKRARELFTRYSIDYEAAVHELLAEHHTPSPGTGFDARCLFSSATVV